MACFAKGGKGCEQDDGDFATYESFPSLSTLPKGKHMRSKTVETEDAMISALNTFPNDNLYVQSRRNLVQIDLFAYIIKQAEIIPLTCSKVIKALCKCHLATMRMLQGKAVGKSTLPVSEIILEMSDCCTKVLQPLHSCAATFAFHYP
jgi:hypothetical protein